MHIVLITDTYYPILSPVSSCMNNYIQELRKEHTIEIISPLSRLIKVNTNETNINYHFVSNWHNSIRALCNTKVDSGINNRFFNFLLVLIRFYGFLLSFYAFPTRRSWLTKKFYKKLKKLERESKIDVIISASDPICSHIAAYQYHKEQPCTKWITFSFDPIASNYYNYNNVFFKNVRKRRLHELSKKIYDSADYNITNYELYNSVLSTYSLTGDSTFCFQYLLSKNINQISKINNSNAKKEKSSEIINFVYAGSLKKQLRNPKQMLSIISSLDKAFLSLFVSGDCDDIINQFKNDRLSISRLIPRDDYIKLITSSETDFLINIGNNGSLQMPSKLLELISTGKPLINFYYDKDYSYDLVQNYPNGINIWQYDDKAKNKIIHFCNKHKGIYIDYKKLEQIYVDNILEVQMKQLNSLLI